jgi:hypothetical protein
MATGGLEVGTWTGMVARAGLFKRRVENENANRHIRHDRHSDVV